MQTFDTPEPISVSLELGVGDVRIEASDRADTVVDVRPSDPAKKSDVAAAEQTRVEYANGRLQIKGPRGWKQLAPWRGGESIDVHIGLPAGSDIRGDVAVAALHTTGRLGDCHYKTSVGDIQIEQAGSPRLVTAVGDITVDRALDHIEVTTRSGRVSIRTLERGGVIKNSNGDTWIGKAAGDLRVSAANGEIVVDQSHGSVAAKTANGDVRVRGVARGSVLAETAYGKIDIGVADGVAAWLDLNTSYGNVQNSLDSAGRPGPDEETVEVRASTHFGDVTVSRSFVNDTRKEQI